MILASYLVTTFSSFSTGCPTNAIDPIIVGVSAHIRQQASKTLVVMSCLPMFFVFLFRRQGFMQPRLPVRWRSLGFIHRMFRSVVVDFFFFSAETLLCGCQKRPVPCSAPGWPQPLSQGWPFLPGCPRMSGSDENCSIYWPCFKLYLFFSPC